MLKLAVILCTVLVGSIAFDVVKPDVVDELLASYREIYESQRTMISENAQSFTESNTDPIHITRTMLHFQVEGMMSRTVNTNITECMTKYNQFLEEIGNTIESIENCVETTKKEILSKLQDNCETLKKDGYQLYNVGWSAEKLNEGEESERRQKFNTMVEKAIKVVQSYKTSFEKILNEKCTRLGSIRKESESLFRYLKDCLY